MKKRLSVFLAAVMAATLLPAGAYADTDFPDLAKEHWSYQNVQQLVADGTISGYEDGTFQPEGIVTRAEFVKMIGKGPDRYDKDFTDVPSTHWAYEYVMYAGMDGVGSSFNPSTPITREDVAGLLWKRAGSRTDIVAPSIVTNQSDSKKNAVAWVYQYGIMNGDDGVHLRLKDSLTRAEAAALIVRSRAVDSNSAQINFADKADAKILERVYTTLNLFDAPYSADETISFGEMARAALRIGTQQRNLTYVGLQPETPFEHEYVKEATALANLCLERDKITAEYINAPATLGDTVAAFAYNLIVRKVNNYVSFGDKTEGYNGKMSDKANMMLTFAEKNGVVIRAGSMSDQLSTPITRREAAALLLQLDNIVGTQTDTTTDIRELGHINKKFDHKVDFFGTQYPDFALTLADMPSVVYTEAFSKVNDNAKTPKETYETAREYDLIFMGMVQELQGSIKKDKGADIRFTYYPSLVANNGNGYTLRLKAEVVEMTGTKAFNEVLPASGTLAEGKTMSKGDTFFIDLMTGGPLTNIEMTSADMKTDKIIFIR